MYGSARNAVQAILLCDQGMRMKWAPPPKSLQPHAMVAAAAGASPWCCWLWQHKPGCLPECLEAREPGLTSSSYQRPCACLGEVRPWSRMWFWEVLLLYPSAPKGGGCGGGNHGPHLQWSVIIRGYWDLPKMIIIYIIVSSNYL